jgi:single-stranded-DNA-specific exonuclease
MKNWNIKNEFKTQNPKLTIQKILDILLKNRGLDTQKQIDEFLNPSLEVVSIKSVGIDKKEIDKTLQRIKKAVDASEKIVIYGDYDVDGICATAILWETIYVFYKNVIPYIPHRVDEGYGLSEKGIDNILLENKDVGLIITVDNGIVAHDSINYANKKKIDIIITDHHVASDKLPKVVAIVHTTKLCGAGVAYLLGKEISHEFGQKEHPNHLELASLATVADVVPLINANRTILTFGLESLRKTKRVGLLALFREIGIEKEKVGVYEIGHMIAPRLNAAGRMSHALDALRLICTTDRVRAALLARQLGETNKDRQLLTEEMRIHAEGISDKVSESEKIIFVHDVSYSQGVIGLIAGRLVERHYKPSFVLSVGEEFSKGSARSVRGFNIIEFIRSFEDYLVDAGGHPMAAGFTIETSKIEVFKKALEKKGKDILTEALLTQTLEIDLELPFDFINLSLFSTLQKLSPFGMGNPEPVFSTREVIISGLKTVGKTSAHLKLLLQKDEKTFSAMWFGNGSHNLKIGQVVDVAYGIDVNEWRDKKELVLKIKDIQ